jgi:hypothetical protein
LHELNAKLLKEFNLKETPDKNNQVSFVHVAKKDSESFYFILVLNEKDIPNVVKLLTPRMSKKVNTHKAVCLGLWNKETKDDEFENDKNLTPLKIEIFDEPFFMYNTYDSSRVY